MLTFAANRKANMALKLMLYAPFYFACCIRWGRGVSIRQQGCFFLNSEQNSVLECNLLLKLGLFATYSNEL